MDLGTIVGDRFAIEQQAGAGGMGTVYRARDRRSGQDVALKVLGAPGAQNAERFVREAEILARLSHPGIVRYVAHGQLADGRLYLAMEWLAGRDLASLLTERGPTLGESVALVARAAEALGAAHAGGVVHRDVKPSNIFLVGGEVERVKIIDFGIARLSSYTRVTTRTGAIVGTPGYIAPEQARGTREPSSETDVFSLGCVLFEMLTGRPPFAGDHVIAVLVKILVDPAPRVSELREDVPPPLDDLVARMLAKDPMDRPRDGAEVAAELSALGGEGADLRGARAIAKPALTARERRFVSVILAAPEQAEPDRSDAPTVSLDEVEATHARIVRLVEGFGGKLDQVADGELLVTLSGNGGAGAQAARAARCALAMRSMLPNAPLVLATGLGVVAERLPVGEAIDRAARMLAAASGAPLAIHVDDATAGLLDARFEVEGEPGSRTIHAEREVDEPVRTLLGKPSPCIGRERELGLLESLFAECVEEQVARAALVTAPPGFGKTRLQKELLARLGGRASVWIGAGDPLGTGSPFGLLGRAARRALGIRAGDPLAARREALLARVAERLPLEERGLVAEFLGELFDVPLSEEESVQLRAARRDPVLMGDRMRWAFGRFLRAEASARPVILVLDDLHWGDLATVKLVDATLRDLADCPILALALARPEIEERFPALWRERGTLVLGLGPLTRRTGERLVREHLGGRVDTAAVARIVDRAEGNALYLEELIRATSEGKDADLPETMLAILDARLGRLDPEARRVLRAASIFGQVFRADGVRALLGGIDRTEVVLDIVRDLVEREVLVPAGAPAGEPAYAFRHVLVREAAYAMLTDADRVLGHRLAGLFLEQAGELDAVIVGEHFERGGERALAAARYRQAAEHALAGADLEAALAWAARADRCGAEGEELGAVRRVEAEAHAFRGANAEAARAGVAAMGLLRRGSAAFFLAAADVATAKSRLDEIGALVALGDDLVAADAEPGALGPHLVALARTAILLLHVGRDAQVARLVACMEALLDRRESLEPTACAWLDRMRAVQALHAGDPAMYLALTAAAAASFEAAGDQRSASMQWGNVGYAYLELGLHAEAVAALRDAREASRRLGAHHNVMLIQHNLGLALARSVVGAASSSAERAAVLAEAAALEAEAEAAFAAQGHPRLVSFARLYRARICALAGDLDEAMRLGAEAVALFAGTLPGRAPALATLADFALAQGRTEEALGHAREAMEILTKLGGIEEGESQIRLAHAEALAAAGEVEAARVAIVEARDRLLARAGRISKPTLRESFLEGVPENARTLALHRAWVEEVARA
ncbi:Adenylate cyclase [Minicystis rosea]|nr:Adenylate cyclase [Minicystis rosea]